MIKVFKIVVLVMGIYTLAYFCFRQSHIENWEFDKQDYVMFPDGQIWLYNTFKPAAHLDEQLTGMHFQIGPHPEIAINARAISPMCLYKNIDEVLHNKNACFWVDPLYADSLSLFVAVHFDQSDAKLIHFNYSHDCIITFECFVENNHLNVLWRDILNCELNVRGKKEEQNKPFLYIELENDSTLKTHIMNNELVYKLNNFDKYRRLIPERFIVMNIKI